MNGSEPLFTYQQSRQLDEITMALGWTSTQLMGQAALSSFYRLIEHEEFEQVIILCGPGNNGGDGFALAWHILSSAGQKHWGRTSNIRVVRTNKARSEASGFYESLVEKQLRVQQANEFLLSHSETQSLQNNSSVLIVEALLGSGQNRPLEGIFAELGQWIQRQNSKGAYVLSLDVPAGLLEDRPFADTSLFYPSEIHTYGPHRLACMFDDTLLRSSIYSNPIGFSTDVNSTFSLVRRNANHLDLFRRQGSSHKYSNGSGWLLGGSSGMEGALLLSARCFFASGGGILQSMSSSPEPLVKFEPSLMQKNSLQLEKVNAVTVGPGCSRDDARSYLGEIEKQFQQSETRPFLILDAAAAVISPEFPVHGRSTILTPHPGEWKSLGGSIIQDVASLKQAMDFAKSKIGSYVLYKGSTSILLDPFEDRAYLFPWPNASLAVAGTGDCLAGILMSALSKSNEMIEAVISSLELLHACTENRVHPRSSRFPALIEGTLRRRLLDLQGQKPGRDATGPFPGSGVH